MKHMEQLECVLNDYNATIEQSINGLEITANNETYTISNECIGVLKRYNILADAVAYIINEKENMVSVKRALAFRKFIKELEK